MLRFFVFLLFIAVAAGAFYGGMRYQRLREAATGSTATPQATPATDSARAGFATRRAAVDADPPKWLAENVTAGSKPLDSKDPEFLYLYGRALMLTGNQHDASTAFSLAIANLSAEQKSSLPLGAEIKLAQADAALKQPSGPSTQSPSPQQQAAAILDELLELKGQVAPR